VTSSQFAVCSSESALLHYRFCILTSAFVCPLYPFIPSSLSGYTLEPWNPRTPAYRLLEHTSDIKVEVYGTDLAELFTNAATCLFDLILDREKVSEAKAVPVSLQAATLPELLLDWLRELLFLFSTRYLAVRRVEIASIEPTRVSATVFGEEFDQERHGLKVEVKTPTYHQYRIDKTDQGYRATVVFDV